MVDGAKGSETFRWSEELWQPSTLALTGVPKRARRAARIRAYVPAGLAGQSFSLDATGVQAVIDAQDAVREAQQYADAVGVNTIAQQLLRSEAIASSQIEGIDVPGHRALAKAAAGNQHKPGAQLVLANIEAVRWVYDWAASSSDPFSPEVICEIHAKLATADRHLSAHPGEIRTRQNWIGRDPYTPVGADFIPPPAREVPELLQDLCTYANRDDVAPVIQAAAVHAQFETIHPFADGNGRVGRSLIGAILARRQVCQDVIPPISLVLSRDRYAYIDALTTWRFELDGHRQWIAELASACEAAALASTRLAGQVAALQERWREAAGHPRRDSAAAAIIDALPAYPILDASSAATVTGRSEVAARQALNTLTDSGVLEQVTVGKRNRIWESVGLFALIDEMERELSAGLRGAAGTQ
jgi:Fic family protein